MLLVIQTSVKVEIFHFLSLFCRLVGVHIIKFKKRASYFFHSSTLVIITLAEQKERRTPALETSVQIYSHHLLIRFLKIA